MDLHEILKVIRKQQDISQEQLAHDLYISFSTLSRWENGHTSPSRLAKLRLLEYCKNHNVSVDIIERLNKL